MQTGGNGRWGEAGEGDHKEVRKKASSRMNDFKIFSLARANHPGHVSTVPTFSKFVC